MSLELNAKETALVLIDLQRGIVTRELKPHTASEVLTKSAKLAEAIRKAGGVAIYVHVLVTDVVRLPTDRSMQRPDAPPPPPDASELVPEAGFREGDVLITKRQWGGFYGTNLEQQLRRRGIKTIILGGVATNLGVESTARAAHDHGYALVFAEDAMSTSSPEMHQFAIETMFPLMGRVRSTEEIVAALGGV
jgi:nicotinamidase-related amidase